MTASKILNIFIETERLLLRQWKSSDRSKFAELNADPENMEYFPNTITQLQSKLFIEKEIDLINKNSFGLFAVETKRNNEFIGFIGLSVPTYKTKFTPCTEIGWRLHKKYWRKGYATEGARAVLDFSFNTLLKKEIVSFTSKLNTPSINVMQKIGMTRDICGDFALIRVRLIAML